MDGPHHPVVATERVEGIGGPAIWTYSQHSGYGAWYFMPTNRTKPPYTRQIVVEAIIDVDADGRLAGVEIIDDKCPGPPLPRLLRE